MKRVLVCLCWIALCSAPGFAQKKGGGAGMSDQQFIDFAAQTDMLEADLGQLAQSNAAAQPVKDYGQTLVTDHTQDFDQLYKVAQQANLNRPNALDSEHEKMAAPFGKLNGQAFDHRYVQEMIAGHTKAIAVYKKEAVDAQNPAVKSYAEQTIPTLQKHLDAAKALEKTK